MPIFSFIKYTLTKLFIKPDNWQQIYKQTSSTFYTSNDVSLTGVEKNLLSFTPLRNKYLTTFLRKNRSSYQISLIKKLFLKIIEYSHQHLCCSLLLILNIVNILRAAVLKDIWERLLLKMRSWNWEKLKNFDKKFNSKLKNMIFSTSESEISENAYLYALVWWLVSFRLWIHI